jgi:cation:H+ antiporter
MTWLIFFACGLVVVLSASRLAVYGDVIALRTGIGRLFIGTLLLATATSLPELLTAVNAIDQGEPNLTAGDIFGSGMFNMLLLAVLDLVHQQKRILRRVATVHALSAGLAVLLTGLAVFYILADIDLSIGWMGADSLSLVLIYIFGMRVINRSSSSSEGTKEESKEEIEPGTPSLRTAIIGFAVATIILLVTTPWLVWSAVGIAEITGVSTGFVGIALVALVTSLPEATTTIAAARLGAYDLAIGNLFGSNLFNIFALGLIDSFYTEGRLLSVIDPTLALAGLMALLLTTLGLIGNLARDERRFFFIEVDALFILLGYGAGLWLLFARGVFH